MEKITQRIGSAYPRRSFVATIGITLLVGAAALHGSSSRAQTTAGGAGGVQQPPPVAAPAGTTVPGQTTPGTTGGVPGAAGQGAPGTGCTRYRAAIITAGGRGFGGGRQRGFGNRGGGATGGMMTLDLHGTDITNVLRLFANAYQMPVVADPTVTGPVTIISPKPVTLDEAFKILQQVLKVRGFTAGIKDGVITVSTVPVGITSPAGVYAQVDTTRVDPKNQIITQVIPLENVNADDIAKNLLPLISKGASLVASGGSNAIVVTDYSENVQQIIDLVAALDKTSTRSEMAIYNLHHAEAGPIADLINNLYGRTTTRGKSSTTPQQGPGGFNPAAFGRGGGGQQPTTASDGTPAVVAIAEPGTNSVIVVASRENQEQITQNIINKLDDDDVTNLSTKLRKIKYADATTLSNTINQALSDAHGAATQSSSGSTFGQRAFGGFAALFGGGQQSSGSTTASTDPFAKVTPEARTNSVLITASAEKMAKIDAMIDELDVAITTQSTTFVIPLSYAQADDIASALTAAFSTTGNSTIYNPQFTGAIGGNGSKGGSGGGIPGHTPIARRQTTSTTGGRSAIKLPTGGQGASQTQPPGPPNAPDGGYQGDGYTQDYGGSAFPSGTPGVMTANGFVPNDSPSANPGALTRQFGGGGGNRGGFGGQAGGQRGNTAGQTVGQPIGGPGQNGSFTGLLQLQGNVVAVPSPNGDSVIVTTTPNNYEAIKGIVEALDTIPRQVMIEVIVAEVSLNTDSKMGFNMTNAISGLGGASGSALLSLPATGFGTSTVPDPSQTGLQAVISSRNHSGLIQALGSDTKVKVLATPSVFTENNQPAIVDIATQVPYITGQALSAVSTTAVVTNTVDFASIGFTLYVTPRITRDGLVSVDCVADASDLVTNLVLGSGSNAVSAPEFDDRYTDTTVTVKDGDTAVIGGLIQDRQTLTINKVPVLSDIPILGQFFRSREKLRTRVELMIFLTPHVVSTTEQATKLAHKVGGRVIDQEPDLQNEQPNLRLTPEEIKELAPLPKGHGAKAPNSSGNTPANSGPKPPPTGVDPSGKPILNPFGTPAPAGTTPTGTAPTGTTHRIRSRTPPSGTSPPDYYQGGLILHRFKLTVDY